MDAMGDFDAADLTIHEYIISVAMDEEPGAGQNGRAELIESNRRATGSFIEHFWQKVTDSHLTDAVRTVDQASAMPVVTLHCTPEVARIVEQMPEVEGVLDIAALPGLRIA